MLSKNSNRLPLDVAVLACSLANSCSSLTCSHASSGKASRVIRRLSRAQLIANRMLLVAPSPVTKNVNVHLAGLLIPFLKGVSGVENVDKNNPRGLRTFWDVMIKWL